MSAEMVPLDVDELRYSVRRIFTGTTLRVVLLSICLLWTLPTAGVFITSFRPFNDIIGSGWWTVFETPFDFTQWTLQHYGAVLMEEGLGNAFINSLIVTIPSTVIPITVAAFAAYAFAWMDFPGRDGLFAVLIALMVMPLQMALIPMLRVYTRLGLSGSFLGIWLAHTGFAIPLAVYLLYNFISQLPRDLIEAATIDGASDFQIFTSIVLRLSTPAIASFAIFQFLWIWNDFLVALVFLGGGRDVTVLTTQLSQLVGTQGQGWHILTAAAFISMLVPLSLFFSLQRYFVRGLLAGSTKG